MFQFEFQLDDHTTVTVPLIVRRNDVFYPQFQEYLKRLKEIQITLREKYDQLQAIKAERQTVLDQHGGRMPSELWNRYKRAINLVSQVIGELRREKQEIISQFKNHAWHMFQLNLEQSAEIQPQSTRRNAVKRRKEYLARKAAKAQRDREIRNNMRNGGGKKR